ncbi:MAG: thioredoxin domain-containing protein [candidate division WOR-3 bacterium]
MKKNYIILIGIVVGIIISFLAFIYSRNLNQKQNIEYKVQIKDAENPTLGYENAQNTIVEYFDFTCPHCANFHLQKLPKLYPKWKSKIYF